MQSTNSKNKLILDIHKEVANNYWNKKIVNIDFGSLVVVQTIWSHYIAQANVSYYCREIKWNRKRPDILYVIYFNR